MSTSASIKQFVTSPAYGIQWILNGGAKTISPAINHVNVKIEGSLTVKGEIINDELEQLKKDVEDLKLVIRQLI